MYLNKSTKRLHEEPPRIITQGLLEHLPLVKNNGPVHAGLYMPLVDKLMAHALATDELLEEARNVLGTVCTVRFLFLWPSFNFSCHF